MTLASSARAARSSWGSALLGACIAFVPLRAPANEPRPTGELEPDVGVFAGSEPEPYRLALRRALLPGPPYRSCQLLTLPASGAERVVYFTLAENGSATVVSRRLRQALWPRLAEIERAAGSRGIDAESTARALARLSLAVDEVAAPLDAKSAALLGGVCRDVLLRVRYPSPPPENSGHSSEESFHAAHWVPGMFLSGSSTVPPGSASVAGQFIVLEQTLERYARWPVEQRADLRAQLHQLAERLARRMARARQRNGAPRR